MSKNVMDALIAVLTGTTVAVLGPFLLRFLGHDGDKKKAGLQTNRYVWAVAVLVGITVFIASKGFSSLGSNTAILQRIQSKPNSVTLGDTVTLTVELNAPAPAGGIPIHLTSSDPAVLTVDGDALVAQGETMGSGYSRVVRVPTYLSPVTIYANYEDTNVHTSVNIVAKNASTPDTVSPTKDRPTKLPPTMIASRRVSEPVAMQQPQQPQQPKALDSEILSRLEDTQGRLAAEKGYWQNVKEHMPANSSLRPEITSQIYGAEATSQRCNKYQRAVDAASLSACIDKLNDNLNELKTQH